MNFKFLYYRTREDRKRRKNLVSEGSKKNVGDWRSRWERMRDLNKGNSSKDQIEKINTRGTDKDYLVTSVLGRSPDKLYFVGFPVKTEKKRHMTRGRGDLVLVKNAKACEECDNFKRVVRKSQSHFSTQKGKSKYSIKKIKRSKNKYVNMERR